MKYLLSILFLFSFITMSYTQATITGFTMSPTNPTSNDTIFIYANLQFSSSSCHLDNQSHSISGLSIEASTHHCFGLLTAICNTVDTFKINPMPAGNYDFNLSLTSGSAPAPCTAGIAADDDSTFSFIVESSGPSGLGDPTTSNFILYPNPVRYQINLPSILGGTAYTIIGISGQVVKSGQVNNQMIDGLRTMSPGLYLLKLETLNGTIVRQISKI